MAEEHRSDERTEPASPKRRQDFRERGEVAKSREIGSVAVLFTAMGCVYFFGPAASDRLSQASVLAIEGLSMPDLTAGAVQRLAIQASGVALSVLLPLFALVSVAALAASVAQTGWLVAPQALAPNLGRVNPLTNFRQTLMSSKTAFEAAKNVLKVGVVGVPIYFALRDEVERLPALIGASADAVGRESAFAAIRITARVGGLLVVVACLDYAWQKWSLERRMRMTFQEVKEELREGEGDPHVRARRRRIAQEMSLNRMMTEVPRADVVLNNPTHFSVALKYDPESGRAPRVVAKGQDLVAMRLREIAREHGVPMLEDPPLCRAIFGAVKIGGEIPPNLYRAVAEVLAVVMRDRKRRPGRAA